MSLNSLSMFDIAFVTPHGICFQQVFYTCSRAIREKWFERALKEGGWSLSIRYTPTDLKSIYIRNEFEDYEECRLVVKESLQGLNIETYLQSVQLMKLAKEILKDYP
jgi:hypothetical protein